LRASRPDGIIAPVVRAGAMVESDLAVRGGVIQAEPGTGQFLPRGPYEFIAPRGVLADGFDAAPPLL
jgi:hypothetical protein